LRYLSKLKAVFLVIGFLALAALAEGYQPASFPDRAAPSLALVIAWPLIFREVSMTETPIHPLGFDELANLLLPLGTINSPSELHGLLCGKLCAGASLNETHWLLEAVEFLDFTQAPDERVRDALSRLYHQSRDQLDQDFSPLLML